MAEKYSGLEDWEIIDLAKRVVLCPVILARASSTLKLSPSSSAAVHIAPAACVAPPLISLQTACIIPHLENSVAVFTSDLTEESDAFNSCLKSLMQPIRTGVRKKSSQYDSQKHEGIAHGKREREILESKVNEETAKKMKFFAELCGIKGNVFNNCTFNF